MIVGEASSDRVGGKSPLIRFSIVSSAVDLSLTLMVFMLNLSVLQAAPSNEGKDLLTRADQLAFQYNWADAEPLYEQAETYFAEAGDLRDALYARVSRIRSWMEYEPLAPLMHEVETILASANLKNDRQLLLRALTVKAEIESQYSLDAAAKTWEQVGNLTQQLNLEVLNLRAQAELAAVAFQLGDIEKVVNTRPVLVAMHEAKDVDAQVRFVSVAAMGICEMGRCEEALGFIDRALAIREANPRSSFPFITYFGKSIALAALRNSSEAQRILERCLAQARLENSKLQEAFALYLLGKLHREQDFWGAAEECLQKAASIAGQMEYRWTLSLAELELTELDRQRGNFDQASGHLTASLEAKKQFGDQLHTPVFLAAEARLQASQGEYAHADALFVQAERELDQILAKLQSAYGRSFLVASMSSLYVNHFSMLVKHFGNIEKAFSIIEQSRGRSEADSLRGRYAADEEKPDQNPVESEIARLQWRLMRTASHKERKDLLEKLFEAEEKLGPSFETGRHSVHHVVFEPAALAVVQSSLAIGELLIEYVLDEPESYCMAISREGVHVYFIEGKKQIEKWIDEFNESIQERRNIAAEAHKLYRALLGPIPELNRANRLTIVPDSRLHLLSFDALVNDQKEYLIQRHVITYVPSGTVLHLLRTLPKQSVDYIPFLGVGDVFYGEGTSVVVQKAHLTRGGSQFGNLFDLEGDHLKPLSSARREVVTLARIVGPGSKTLLGNHATETEVKAQPLSRFRILHFAAHGIADTVFPRRSSIVLGSSPYSSDDGLLQSWEISSFRLNADLVTLSACETKIGRLQGQEGVSNLVRAFLFAGARSVVASSWATEDMFTLALMEQFYRHLASGTDKGAALRQAKLDLMERFGSDALPFHWASFSIVGDGSSAIDLSHE